MRFKISLLVICLVACQSVRAQQTIISNGDTIQYRYTPEQRSVPQKPSFIQRSMGLVDRMAADDSDTKRLDVNIIPALSYSQERSFGGSLMLTGLYRTDRRDTICEPSLLSIRASGTLVGYYAMYSEGMTLFDGGKHRFDHSLTYAWGPRLMWGIGYEDGRYNTPINYGLGETLINVAYRYNVNRNFILGAVADFKDARGEGIENLSYINYESTAYRVAGTGLILELDSRDAIASTREGAYLSAQGLIYPKGFGTASHTFAKAEIMMAYFQPLWRGAVLGAAFKGEFSSEHTPWTMLSPLGDYNFMRGYYWGRYIDNNAISGQFELRQDVWWRLKIATWVGAGNASDKLRNFDISQTLPNYGVGIHIEVKDGVLLRVDHGRGCDSQGFMIRIHQAF